MNKQEAIKTIEAEWLSSPVISLQDITDIINMIDEPQKPVVTKFVADFYESIKDRFESKVYELCLQYNRGNCELSSEFEEWFNWGENEPIQTLVKMKLYGYEVKQEKLYTVEIPNPNSDDHTILQKTDKGIVLIGVTHARWRGLENSKLTEAEIRKDFEWAWQFAKPVEEK